MYSRFSKLEGISLDKCCEFNISVPLSLPKEVGIISTRVDALWREGLL